MITLASRRAILGAAALLSTCAAHAGAASDVGSRAAPFLRAPVGARWTGMGGAASTLAEDATALSYNPAGLAEARGLSLTSEYVSGLVGSDRQYLGAALPVGEAGGVGVAFRRWGYGEENRTLADASGAFAGSAGTFDASDLAVEVGYGTRVSVFRVGALRVGATVGFVRQKVDDVTGDGAFLTLGARWEDRAGRLRLAAAARHLGTKIEFLSGGARPPSEGVLGISYRLVPSLLVSGDLSYAEDGRENIRLGAAWSPSEWIVFRGGYDAANDADDGFSLGLGVAHEGAALDYAYAPFGDLGEDHRVSLTYEFGGHGGGTTPMLTPKTRAERKR